jgi:ATP adenylyltransferase
MKKATPPKDCFFCAYARDPKKDLSNLVVHRGRSCFIVLNRFPYQGGHLLIAPFAHKADLALLSETERTDIFDCLVLAQKTLDSAMNPQGYNIGLNVGRAAGAGVPGHIHFHIVPRWNGDANFMASVSNTRVIPQALKTLHAELQKTLRRRR